MNELETRKADDSGRQRNRLIAASIMLLPLLVVVCASALWWAVQRGHIDIVDALGTHNHGQLINPVRDFDHYSLRRVDGSEYRYRDQAQKWTLVIIGDGQCSEEVCQQRLWLTRQLHTALGRRAQYLRRVYLTAEAPVESRFDEFFATEHPNMTVLEATADDLQALAAIASEPDSAAAFYLVDKRGYLMMFYTDDNTGKDVIADLKFLMKQSGDE